MRISALAAEAGLPVATVKFYLRQRLMHPGIATSATQANYDESHVRRLRVIRALTGSVGLSVQQARTILELIDDPGDDLYTTLGRAVGALPPTAVAPGDAAVQETLPQVELHRRDRQARRVGESGDAHVGSLHWIVSLSSIGEYHYPIT